MNVNNPLSFKSLLPLYGLSLQNFTKTPLSNPLIATSSISSNDNYFNILTIEEDEKEEIFNLSEKIKIDKLEFPLSKISFSYLEPFKLATSDVELTIYDLLLSDINEIKIQKVASLRQNEEFPAPLTSFDWNKVNNSLIIASSFDTTCSVWDLNSNKVTTRLIAHDKEVYDVSYLEGEYEFISAGADGEIRLFDIRDLESSQIVFDSNNGSSLTRIAVNPNDSNYITVLTNNKPYFYIIDLREISSPVGIIQSHSNIINSVQWSSENTFCTAGDDKNIFIWDINRANTNKPLYSYTNEDEINNIDWKSGIIAFNSSDQTKILTI